MFLFSRWSATSYSSGQNNEDDDGEQENEDEEEQEYEDEEEQENEDEEEQENEEEDEQENEDEGEQENANNEEENNVDEGEENEKDEEQQDNQNDRRRYLNDRAENQQQCGQYSQSEEQWWMGMQQCMGANVAFSLYGILSGDTIGVQGACRKATFINSFFTRDGLDNFAQASNGAVDTSSLSQSCSEYGDNGKYSMTTRCSSTGQFTVDTFNGQSCSSNSYVSTVDTLADLNAALTDYMDCIPIYSSDGSVDYATELLSNSTVCSVDGIYRGVCPDPHGLLKTYESNFAKAQKYGNYEVSENRKMATCILFFAAGVFLLLSRAYARGKENQLKKWAQENGVTEPELWSADYNVCA